MCHQRTGDGLSQNQNVSRKRTVNLPKLPLPRFEGNLLKWTTFHDSFTSAVHNDASLSDVQRFQYLRGQLDGEAARAIEGLALTNDNYNKAQDILAKRFGQKHKLINAYMRALWEIEQPADTVEQLRTFHDGLESHVRGLEALGTTEGAYGALLVPVIMDKLPARVRTLITRDHGDCEWALDDLRTTLLREVQAAEAGTSGPNAASADSDTMTCTAAFLVQGQKPQKQRSRRPNCSFCKRGPHPSAECRLVKDPAKRLQIVKRDSLCFNCLSPDHRAAACTVKHRCHTCNRRHHSSLCDQEKSDSERTTEKAETVHAKLNNAYEEKTLQQGHVLLKTAVTKAVNNSRRISVNVLLDEGSQRSFISQDCADKLKLKPEATEAIKLAPFGSTGDGVRAIKSTSVTLESTEGPITLNVLMVPRISSPLRTHVTRRVRDLPYLQGLKLAQTSDSEIVEIDLLIGADYYWTIVGDKVIRGPGPTAVSSKFGYLLSGPRYEGSDASTPPTTVLSVLTDSRMEEKIMSQYWDLETIGIKEDTSIVSKNDEFENYRDTHLRFENGTYTASLPWREDHPPLPSNYAICRARTRAMVRRLTPDMLGVYNRIIGEQLESKFISRVNDGDKLRGHYLPHHPVKKESETTCWKSFMTVAVSQPINLVSTTVYKPELCY